MHLLISLLLFTFLSWNSPTRDVVTTYDQGIDTLYAYVDDQNKTYFQYFSPSGHISHELQQQFHVRKSDMLLFRSYASDDTVSTGLTVLIPFAQKELLKTKSATTDCIPVIYTVRKKETVFKIARRYFDLKLDQLRKLNNLPSNDISIDQQLLVGWFVLHPVGESLHTDDLPARTPEPIDPFYPEDPTLQIGVAYWKKTDTHASHMFAMHRSARINSMIEITNPMFKSKVLVKVVGRIPPTYKDDIALVVSPAVAKKLGVLDPRFRAEMRFVE